MAGLNLYAGGYGGGRASGGPGNYSPMTPGTAVPSTSPIANQAYGVNASGADDISQNVAWMGSIAVGVIAALALAYLWWSLPR